jgi:hypothetical protein
MSREASELPSPQAPADLKDRILQRLHDGERVILPVADPGRPALPGRRIAAAFAATMTVAIAASIFSARELASEASDLTYSPSQPVMGDVVEFEYNATSAFAGEDTLILRAVYRRATDGNTWHEHLPVHTVATLEDDGDGSYGTTFTLPDDVVYAVFAVEDQEGRQVDSRGQAAWELLAHEGGQPTFDALMQKYYDLVLRNWKLAGVTAKQITELYPDEPGGWWALSSLEQLFYSPAEFSRWAEPGHREEFARLEGILRHQTPLSGATIGGMYWYARTLGDVDAEQYWQDRMLTEAPNHVLAADVRVGRADQILAEFESLWGEGGFDNSALAEEGFRAALTSEDSEALPRWLGRLEETQPSRIEEFAQDIAATPGWEARGIEHLRSILDRLDRPSGLDRSLFRTTTEQRVHVEDRKRVVAGILGRALVKQDRVAEGMARLLPALSGSWDLGLFSEAAEIQASLGDPSTAFELWARVAVDPRTDSVATDSIAEHAMATVGVERWLADKEKAREFMAAHFLSGASPSRFIPLDLEIRASDGTVGTLGGVIDGGIAGIAFWSQEDYNAIQDTAALSEIYRKVGRYDAKLITLVDDPLAEAGLFEVRRDLPFPVYQDVGAGAKQAFDVWSVPDYFIVDGSGLVRFANSHVDDLLRQVAALRYESPWAVTSLVTEEASRPQ